jgi:hypothetical protein
MMAPSGSCFERERAAEVLVVARRKAPSGLCFEQGRLLAATRWPPLARVLSERGVGAGGDEMAPSGSCLERGMGAEHGPQVKRMVGCNHTGTPRIAVVQPVQFNL